MRRIETSAPRSPSDLAQSANRAIAASRWPVASQASSKFGERHGIAAYRSSVASAASQKASSLTRRDTPRP
jgi:hypothetical protein